MNNGQFGTVRQHWHECHTCGETDPSNFHGRQKSRCKKCQGKLNEAYRIQRRIDILEYKGGKCSRCGYEKCRSALELHHRDPTQKDPQIFKRKSNVMKWERLIPELDKCDLVCANCHREIHANQ